MKNLDFTSTPDDVCQVLVTQIPTDLGVKGIIKFIQFLAEKHQKSGGNIFAGPLKEIKKAAREVTIIRENAK